MFHTQDYSSNQGLLGVELNTFIRKTELFRIALKYFCYMGSAETNVQVPLITPSLDLHEHWLPLPPNLFFIWTLKTHFTGGQVGGEPKTESDKSSKLLFLKTSAIERWVDGICWPAGELLVITWPEASQSLSFLTNHEEGTNLFCENIDQFSEKMHKAHGTMQIFKYVLLYFHSFWK